MPYTNHINAIYRIVNKQTGVCYVGQSQNVQKRLKEHFRMLRLGKHDNVHLQRAYRAYGEANFYSEVEVVCEETEDLDAIEEAFLSGDAFFDTPCVYNIAEFSKAPMRGKTHSPEVRARISVGRNKTTFDYSAPDFRAKLKEAQRKRLFSDPDFVARVKFIVENPHMSFAERGRVVGISTGVARRLALKYAHLKGTLQ